MKPAPPTMKNAAAHGSVIAATDSHLVACALQRGMADEQVPDHGAQALGVRRDAVGEASGGMTTQASATCAVKPPSRPTMPKTLAPASPRQLEGPHQVTRDAPLGVAAADREDEQAVVGASREPCSHSAKMVSQPSSLIRAVSSETLSVGA